MTKQTIQDLTKENIINDLSIIMGEYELAVSQLDYEIKEKSIYRYDDLWDDRDENMIKNLEFKKDILKNCFDIYDKIIGIVESL